MNNTKLLPEDSQEVAKSGFLSALFEWQRELIDIVVPPEMDPQHCAKLMVGCVLGEAAEANAHFLNETKPWKPSEPNWDAVDEEMIDVLHFLLEYWIMRGYTPYRVVAEYREKNLINQERVASKLKLDGGTH